MARLLRRQGWWIPCILLALISIGPFLWVLLVSFKTQIQAITNTPVTLWPQPWTGAAYIADFSGTGSNVVFLLNSFLVATITTLATLLLSIPAAYSLARFRIRGARNTQFWLVSIRMMPPVVAVIPMAVLLKAVGLFGSDIGLTLVYVVANASFAVWMLTIHFKEVPIEVEESAHIDGASHLQSMTRILIPLAAAGIAVVAVFTFIFSWNDLLYALILTQGSAETLPVALSTFASDTSIPWPNMAAMSMAQILPAVAVVSVFQKYIVGGLSMGAVRG